ncbi:hypothetical protein D9M71_473690 [compost metagenome]
MPLFAHLRLQAAATGLLGDDGAEGGVHPIQDGLLGMAQVHRQHQAFRYCVARPWIDADVAEGDPRPGPVLLGQAVKAREDGGQPHEGIAAHAHGCRARVYRLPAQRQVVPADALYPGDHAQLQAFALENGPLLDVHLECGGQGRGPRRPLAEVADARQFRGDARALLVRAAVAVGEVEGAGPDAGADHRRRESSTLFVGPDRYLQRRAGADAGVGEGLDHLQAGQHAIDAIEAAAGGLGVQMRAAEHRRQLIIEARPAGEDVAHLVHADRATRFAAPAHEEIAANLVQVGQRLAVATAPLRGADPRHVHEAAPEALAVDA